VSRRSSGNVVENSRRSYGCSKSAPFRFSAYSDCCPALGDTSRARIVRIPRQGGVGEAIALVPVALTVQRPL
jgi:hypothetical protein